MITFIQQKRPSLIYRLMSCFIVFSFIFSSVLIPNQAYAQFAPNTVLNLPVPGTLLNVTTGFQPALIKGIMTHPENPLEFDFIVVQGDNKLSGEVFNEEARNMIKYFLAALTTPEDEMWVNLSPYEGGRIIPAGFGTTEMGRDLLAQDYILKQLTASLMYPEDKLGGEFWKRVHKKAQALYGTTDIPMNTFNKIWIVPKSAVIYQKGSNAFVVENKLKVMLEEDYIALNANIGNKQFGADQVNKEEAEVISGVTSEVVREVLIPEIEHEVNYGQHFAKLRQIANAMVLATWYKQALKESLLGHVYVNQNKTRGIDVDDKAIKDKIYEQYIEAFQKGVYNYIKEYYDPTTEEVIPRKYFSGGFVNEYQKPEVTRILDGDREVAPADQALVNQQLGTIPASDVLQVSAGLLEASPGADQEAIIQIEGASQRNPVDLNLGPDNLSITPKNQTSDNATLGRFSLEGWVLGLTDFDKSYMAALYAKFVAMQSGQAAQKPLVIGQNFKPSALLSKFELASVLGARDYGTEIADKSEYIEAAKRVVLIANPMNGGLGSSVTRKTYLEQVAGRSELGAKGTDLFFDVIVNGFNEDGTPRETVEKISVTELKYIQALRAAGKYRNIIVQELVNEDSVGPMNKFLDETIYLFDRIDQRPGAPKRTYAQILKQTEGIELATGMIMQGALPVIDAAKNELTIDYTAPGGHGQLGSMVLQEALTAELPQGFVLIRAVFNGDGPNNTISEDIAGFMARENIPIVMISTTKTSLDKKGGLIGIEVMEDGSGSARAQMLELAQAKANKQEPLFIAMGLTEGQSGGQYFNTNIAAVNYTALQPFLRELKAIIGEDKFNEIVTPDLIPNEKKKGERRIVQLEGAMGSALLNLNGFVTTTDNQQVKELMLKYGYSRLLTVVNTDKDNRTKFFTPIKFAYDFVLYAQTDHFGVDIESGTLVNLKPGHLPGFGNMDDYYADVLNSVNAFRGVSMVGLEEINIAGKVNMPGAVLRGKVDIRNLSQDVVDLNAFANQIGVDGQGRLLLENLFIEINPEGQLTLAQDINTPEFINASTRSDNAVLAVDETVRDHKVNGVSIQNILDKIIKEYDIRGFDGFGDKTKFPQQMDETLLRWIGRGLATTEFRSDVHDRTVSLREGDTFVIAGDNGPSTQWVKDNLIEGLREAGIKVIDLGGSREGETSVTSGHLYKSIKTLGAQGGLYVTRSHVEVGTNGAKPNIGGITLYGDMLMKMKETILSGQYHLAENPGDLDVSQETRDRARQEYYRSLRDQFAGLKEKLESSGMKVSVNFAGGSSTSYRDLFQDLLGTSLVRIIRDKSDPFNEEGGLADPSRADTVALANEKENVIAYSLEHPDEHIINFDLDADRVSLVLNGRLYLGDEIFYPVIEYMLTIDQYKDINLKQPVWVDSRMKSTVAQLAMYFGGIALKHPKGHSKVKATMDIMLQNIARDQGFDSVQAFLDANPGYFNAQAEYSLHMFRTNQRGEAFDDAIDFGLFWLDVFSQVKNKYGQPQWTYADYVQHLTDLGAIAPPVQLNEQRFPMNEEAKMEVMREATRLIQAYFQGRTDFTYEPSWRERTTTPAAFHLVNVDGVFDFETPIGQAFWGWSNTSPKDAFGVQSENAEQTRRLTEVITAILIHSRESVGQRLGLNLGKIDDTETAGLMNMFGVQSAVDRLGLDLTGISENDVSTLKGMRDVGAIVKKAKELGLDTSRYAASSPAQLSDLTKQFAQARSNELEAGILAKYPTVTSALEGLTSDSAALAQAKESFETDLRQVIMRTVANRQERIFDSMLADVMNKRERILANKDVIDSNDLTFFETLPAVLESLRVQLSPDTLGKLSLDELKVLNAQMQALQKKMERIWTLDFVQISSIIAASSYKPTLEEQERRVPARFFDSDIARREAIQKTQGVQPRWGSERADTIDAAVLVTVKDEDIDSLVQAINRELDTLLAVEENRAGTILAELKEADQNKFTRAFGERDYQINGRQFVTALAGQLSLAAVDLAQAFSRSPNSLLAELGREASSLQLPGVTARAAIGIGEDEGYVETAGITETTGQQAATPVGGIDLNPKLLDLQIRRDDSGVPLPFNQQPIENMNIDGFIPVIINVTPVNNLPLILGLKEEDKEKIAGHVEGGEEPLQLSYMIKVDKFKLNESLE